jgi:hypothetical protein
VNRLRRRSCGPTAGHRQSPDRDSGTHTESRSGLRRSGRVHLSRATPTSRNFRKTICNGEPLPAPLLAGRRQSPDRDSGTRCRVPLGTPARRTVPSLLGPGWLPGISGRTFAEVRIGAMAGGRAKKTSRSGRFIFPLGKMSPARAWTAGRGAFGISGRTFAEVKTGAARAATDSLKAVPSTCAPESLTTDSLCGSESPRQSTAVRDDSRSGLSSAELRRSGPRP